MSVRDSRILGASYDLPSFASSGTVRILQEVKKPSEFTSQTFALGLSHRSTSPSLPTQHILTNTR